MKLKIYGQIAITTVVMQVAITGTTLAPHRCRALWQHYNAVTVNTLSQVAWSSTLLCV